MVLCFTQWVFTALELGTAVPTKPAITAITRGSGENATVATVSFSAPKKAGCGPLTGYTLTATPVSGGATVTKTVGATRTTTKVSGLVSNQKYNFTLSASNACGASKVFSYVETLHKSGESPSHHSSPLPTSFFLTDIIFLQMVSWLLVTTACVSSRWTPRSLA